MSINLIVSYPRSGSTFVRYIIEHFTRRPTRGPPTSTNLIDSPLIAKYRNEKTVAFKIHGQDKTHQEYIQAFMARKIPLIFLMRNPMEMFPRHTGIQKWTTLACDAPIPPLSSDISYFFDNIKTYESYEGKKQIFYYEELVEEPASVIKQLCEFLQVDLNGAEQRKFMDNFEEHFENSRTTYNTHQGNEPQNLEFDISIGYPTPRTETLTSFEAMLGWAKEQYDNKANDAWDWSNTVDLKAFKLEEIKVYEEAQTPEQKYTRPLIWQYITSPTTPDPIGIKITHPPSDQILGLTIIVPTTLKSKGMHSDGKTIANYSLRLTPKQQENFWINFKELCGPDNWSTCERYMGIKYGEEK
jgi:hypothetical protein